MLKKLMSLSLFISIILKIVRFYNRSEDEGGRLLSLKSVADLSEKGCGIMFGGYWHSH